MASMRAPKKLVIIYGEDCPLVSAVRFVLRTRGYMVCGCTEEDQVQAALTLARHDDWSEVSAVVLVHTMVKRQADAIRRIAKWMDGSDSSIPAILVDPAQKLELSLFEAVVGRVRNPSAAVLCHVETLGLPGRPSGRMFHKGTLDALRQSQLTGIRSKIAVVQA